MEMSKDNLKGFMGKGAIWGFIVLELIFFSIASFIVLNWHCTCRTAFSTAPFACDSPTALFWGVVGARRSCIIRRWTATMGFSWSH